MEQLVNILVGCIPQVDLVLETNREYVILAPLQDVEIKIVHDVWGI